MAYLLDTDIVIDRLARDPATAQLLGALAPAGFSMSIISYIEVLQGVFLSSNPLAERATLEALVVDVPLLPLTESVAERCAYIRADLASRQRRVRSRALDLIVAATAIEHGLTLITRNKADYHDIPNLSLF